MSFNLFLLFQIASFLNHLYFITEPILGTWSTFLSSHRGGLYHNSHFFFTDPCINFFPQKSLRVIWHWNTMPVLTGYFLILLQNLHNTMILALSMPKKQASHAWQVLIPGLHEVFAIDECHHAWLKKTTLDDPFRKKHTSSSVYSMTLNKLVSSEFLFFITESHQCIASQKS